MQAEVPGYVQYETRVSNSVQVSGGSNWDLARGAVATPIAPLADPQPVKPATADCPCTLEAVRKRTQYEPQHHMPQFAADVMLTFSKNSVLLSSTSQKALKAIPRRRTVIVAGHADVREKHPLQVARKRAEAVAQRLAKRGVDVVTIRSFGVELPLTELADKANSNRRVEVFVLGR